MMELSPAQPAPGAIIPMLADDPQCAWCVAEEEDADRQAGRPVKERHGTHGICETHEARVLANRRADKAARQQQMH